MKQNNKNKPKRKNKDKKQQRVIRQIKIPQTNQNLPYMQHFLLQLRQNIENDRSIKEIIKKSFEKVNREHFQKIQSKNVTKQIFDLIMQDLNKKRNQQSNPSLFIKFLANLKLSMLSDNDMEKLINFLLDKINKYISCDKNILYLLLQIVKYCVEKVKNKLKQKIFDEIYNSFLLYFYEFRNFEYRKDNEILKNYILHYRLFIELNKKKPSNYFNKENCQFVIYASLQSFFLGSILENQNFSNLDNFFDQLKTKINRKQNSFYFANQNNQLSVSFEQDISSFSDCMNIIPQQQTNYEIIQDLYTQLVDILKYFLKKFMNNFYKGEIWIKIIGDSYISNSIKDYFFQMDFQNCKFKDYILNQHTLNSLFSQPSTEQYQIYKQQQKFFNRDHFDTHYKLYSQKLSQNDESLVLLFLTSKQNFVRQSVLKVIQNLLKALPVDFFKQKDNINQIEIMTVQMTRSFKSFQLILFQEIMNCKLNDEFLIHLIQFLVFLIEEDLYLHGDFSIFQKIVEYIMMKAIKVQNQKKTPQKLFYSAVRLLRFFIPQTETNISLLTQEQVKSYNFFCQEVLVVIIRKIFESNLEKTKEFDDIIVHSISIIGKLLRSENLNPFNQVLNVKIVFQLVMKMIEQKNQNKANFEKNIKRKNLDQLKGEKIKSKWFSSIMNFISFYKNDIIDNEKIFIYYKVMLAYMIGFSQNDSIFCLSMINHNQVSKIIFLQKRCYLKDEEFKSFCTYTYELIEQKHKGNINILQNYLNLAIRKQQFHQKDQNLYVKIVQLNLWLNQPLIKKVYVLFLLNSFKNDCIQLDSKQEILMKIFKTKTKDSQDLFEGLLQIILKNNFPVQFFKNKTIFSKLLYFLFAKIQEESVQKTVLKTLFAVIIQYADQGFFNSESYIIVFKNLIKRIEKHQQKNIKNKVKRRSSQPRLLFNNDNQYQKFYRNNSCYYIRHIVEKQKQSKKVKKHDFTIKQYIDVLQHNESLNQKNLHFQFFLQYIFEKIKLIKEHKTHGFFFLQIVNLFKIFKDLNLNYLELIDTKIIQYYISLLGNNIIVDSYLTKSFFIEPSIIDLLTNEQKQKVTEYILNFDQIEQNSQKQEFNNNQVMCKKMIDKYIFELKLYIIKQNLQSKQALIPTRKYLQEIQIFLDSFQKFIKFNCGVIFVEIDEKNKQIQKSQLEINNQNYTELNQLQEFLKENHLRNFDKFQFLKYNFQVLTLIENFVENDDQIVIDMNKFDQISQLKNYEIKEESIIIPNVWEQSSNFLNSFN